VPEQDQDSKLLRRTIGVAVAVTIIVVVAAVLLWVRPWSPGAERRVSSAGQQKGEARTSAGTGFDTRTRPTPVPMAFGAVLVNDSRGIELGRGTPVFVCLVIESDAVKFVELGSTDAVSPIATSEGRGVVGVEWEPIPPPASIVEPGRPVTLTWVARTAIPAGRYSVTFAQEVPVLQLVKAGLSAFRIEPGSFSVVDRADDPAVSAHYRRRVLGLRGHAHELVVALEAAVKADPSSPALRRELVDALDQAGRPAEALSQLERLAAEIQDRQVKAQPSTPPEMPDWVVFRLAELRQRADSKK
jgi:hypothetical protein